jgi:Uma2 family endonuclease
VIVNARAYAPPRLFTVEEYYRMTEAGIFHEDDRVELMEGEVVTMSPIGSRHAACVEKAVALIRRAVAGRKFSVRTQNPIRLNDYSEPQPDISVVRDREDFYAAGHPTPDDIVLLVEVAEASLMYDRHSKLPLYARSGIAEVWLVDLVNRTVEVHSTPAPAGYSSVRQFRQGATLVSAALPDLQIAVDDVLA